MRFSHSFATAICVWFAAPAVFAQSHGHDGMDRPTPEQRAQMMRRIHTNFVVELGEILALDTAGTLKLAEHLQHFDDQRVQLRLENADAMHQLREGTKQGTAVPEAAKLARKVALNRVTLAQIDQAELEEILKSAPPDKVAKVALFMNEYPKRVERMAHELHQERWPQRSGPTDGE